MKRLGLIKTLTERGDTFVTFTDCGMEAACIALPASADGYRKARVRW
jgi:hypothetical protein